MNSSSPTTTRHYLAAFALILLCVASTSARAIAQADDTDSSEIPLRWSLSEGDQFVSVLTQSTKITSEVDKQKRIVENEIVLRLQWAVEESADNQFVIRQTISSLQLDTLSPTTGKRVRINTEASPSKVTKLEKSIKKQLEPIVGAEFILTLSARGEVVDVAIEESMLEKLRNIPGSLNVRQLFSTEGLKDIYGRSLMLFPEEPVGRGSKWQTQELRSTLLGKLQETNNYTVKRPEGQANFEIAIETKVVQTDKATDQVQVDPSGKQLALPKLERFEGSGSLTMDAKNEYVRESRFRNIMATSRPYREQTMKSEVETTITSKLERGSLPGPKATENSTEAEDKKNG